MLISKDSGVAPTTKGQFFVALLLGSAKEPCAHGELSTPKRELLTLLAAEIGSSHREPRRIFEFGQLLHVFKNCGCGWFNF